MSVLRKFGFIVVFVPRKRIGCFVGGKARLYFSLESALMPCDSYPRDAATLMTIVLCPHSASTIDTLADVPAKFSYGAPPLGPNPKLLITKLVEFTNL